MSRKSTVSSWLSYYSTFYRVCKPILFAKGWKIVKKWPLHGNQGPMLVHDFLSACVEMVHLAHPGWLALGFEFLSDALGGF